MITNIRSKTMFEVFEFALITIICLIPLLITLPYRINIFLSFEGAYRLYLGQIPFKDFGLPMGPVYWLLPATFFKLFGPSLKTLVITQVFINMLFLFGVRYLMKLFLFDSQQRIINLFIVIITFTFVNFWPWYNYSVFVFQFLGMLPVVYLLLTNQNTHAVWGKSICVSLAVLLNVLSFFTKQDAGGLGICLTFLLFAIYSINQRSYYLLLGYTAGVVVLIAGVVYIFIPYDFGYWFNYGQFPHSSRLSPVKAMAVLFGESTAHKAYLSIILGLNIYLYVDNRKRLFSLRHIIITIIGVFFVMESVIIEVTSPLPEENHIYHHGFFWIYMTYFFQDKIRVKNFFALCGVLTLVFMVMSAPYWGYINRLVGYSQPKEKTAQIKYATSQWISSPKTSAFSGVTMPTNTLEGIEKLKDLPIWTDSVKVLNMTELTPLAKEMNYTPMTDQPLWYHERVGIFERGVSRLKNNIDDQLYDIVLFQEIQGLENFYPERLREELKSKYCLVETFEAPRQKSEGDSFIEVYLSRKNYHNIYKDACSSEYKADEKIVSLSR
ncbi:hypothetical protein V6R21_29625 [Limibacter armeniacum]|uniref:hypothetical protein n=1 Tax=Limibacter armeniacum TaxID=466084 RepID=UPI002FE564F9